MQAQALTRIFTNEWVESVIERWNTETDLHGGLAGAGDVAFRCIVGEEERACAIRWDDEGKLGMAAGTPNDMPAFSARHDQWEQLFKGELSNANAVISGKIKFNGSPLFLFKFGPAFESFINVIKKVEDKS